MSWQTVVVCAEHYKEQVPEGELNSMVRLARARPCYFCGTEAKIPIRLDVADVELPEVSP